MTTISRFLATPCPFCISFTATQWLCANSIFSRLRLVVLTLLLVFLTLRTSAQSSTHSSLLSGKFRPLGVGDTMPNLTLHNVLNHHSPQSSIADHQGKLLILDFMATWCSLCTQLYTSTDSLQKVFADKVKFLPVTYQSEEEVVKFLRRLQSKGFEASLPIVVSDTVLRSLFPHRYVPHYVWIDAQGVIRAITGFREVTAINIEKMLRDHTTVNMVMKNDHQVPYNRDDLLVAGNQAIPFKNILYQSAFTGYIEGLPSSYTVTRKDTITGQRIVATNTRIATLYKLAYGSLRGHFFSDNTIIIESQDPTCCSSKLTGSLYAQWLREHSYGYELIVPPSMFGKQAQIMQRDLTLMFPQYKASVEKRKFPCLALVRTSNKDKLKAKGVGSLVEATAYGCEIKNQTLTNLILQLNAKYLQHLATPVVDQTNYTGLVDLSIQADMGNVAAIRSALQRYDLDLVTTEQDVDVLIIRDALHNSRN